MTSSSCVWLDALNHPYLIDLIVQCSAPDVLLSFRATSRWWRRRVDALLVRHLVLDGQVVSTSHGHACAARLHFGIPLMPLMIDEASYGRYAPPTSRWRQRARRSADSSQSAGVEIPDPVPFPIMDVSRTLNLTRTSVLDVRGAVRKGVLEAISKMVGRLDTIRVYDYPTSNSYPVSNTCSVTWWFGVHEDHPISARRCVLFGSLVPYHGLRTNPLHFCPADAEELIVRLEYNPHRPLARLNALFPRTPDTLRRAVFLFVPTNREPVLSSHDQFGTSLSPGGVAASLTQTVIRLGVPVLFVGAEALAGLPGIADVPVEFVTSERFRIVVGEETWALFTNEAGPAPLMRIGKGEGHGFQHINMNQDSYAQTDRTAWRNLALV